MDVRTKCIWSAIATTCVSCIQPSNADEGCFSPKILDQQLTAAQPIVALDPMWLKTLEEGAQINFEAVLRQPEGGEVERIQVTLPSTEQHWSIPLTDKHFEGRNQLKLALAVQVICPSGQKSPVWRRNIALQTEPSCAFVKESSISYVSNRLSWTSVGGAKNYEVCYVSRHSERPTCVVTDVNVLNLPSGLDDDLVAVTPLCKKGRGAPHLLDTRSQSVRH